MEKQIIISIGREFGSGGHEVAEKVAERLGLPLYDRNLLDHMMEEKMVQHGMHKYDEKKAFIGSTRHVRGFTNSIEENLLELQFEFIKKKAAEGGSFVVVGRCSEAALKGHPGLISIFILGDRDTKVERVMKRYDLSKDEALSKMNRHDKNRKNYHNHFAKTKWGDSRSYDLCINSSRLGIEGTVDAVVRYANARRDLL